MLLPIQMELFWSQNFTCCGTRVTSSASNKSIPSTAKYCRIRTKTFIKTEYLIKFWDQYPPKNLYLRRLRFKSNSPTSIKYHCSNYNFRLRQKFKKKIYEIKTKIKTRNKVAIFDCYSRNAVQTFTEVKLTAMHFALYTC